MRRAIFVATTLLYQLSSQASLPAAPVATLPEGLELITAAASPLVKHPLMGCIDPDGALYVGDAQGLNLNKPELEKQLPNRVLKLVDEDGDGKYDRSTIFAEKMTFPQGACWLGGSLYVASPPGIWKLTDTNQDGVADERTMIVGGFDYTGNAADVHGPFVHPNGRLYWCHGRKGHDVVQGDGGKRVHKGLASGIWSCLPDGSDIQWHSLACADNPVEVDFTPSGDIIGTCNLYQSQPRGDTLMHWLRGGVYERPDMMQAIVDLPRTLEHMPVMYNYGHVAVSGCAFYRTGALFPGGPRLQMFVTHFNTQRLVRMELEPSDSTYTATEHEFLKMEDPDIHLTDVIEDRDGSLIVLNTGGWFRIGCPSSLMAKPDVLGAVYRVRKQGQPRAAQRVAWAAKLVPASPSWEWKGTETLLKALQSEDRHLQRHACDAIASGVVESPLAEGLNDLLSQELDPVLEHAAVNADMVMRRRGMEALQGKPLSGAQEDRRLSRSLLVQGQLLLENAGGINPASVTSMVAKLDQDGAMFQGTVDAGLFVLDRLPGVADQCEATFMAWLNQDQVRPRQRLIMERVLCNRLEGP
ncbi:MAG TPA: PVC-type heme-binding CxxCH protein, partial [Verrucomicrobium sp.]|nr:PVC-type heme-binding CxxCH protein [Verrucomicrobium sp.]